MRIGVMEVMIELVVDANVLVGELLRARGQDLLEHIDLHLMIAPRAANEAHHEIQRWRLQPSRSSARMTIAGRMDDARDCPSAITAVAV